MTCQVQQAAGGFANSTNAVVEIGSGVYRITLTTSEANAASVMLKFTAVGATARFATLVMQPT